MFDHLLAFPRFGFDQELIDHSSAVGLFAQAGGSLLQVLGPVRLLAGGGLQGISALLAAC